MTKLNKALDENNALKNKEAPNNVHAEQAIIGACLMNNDNINKISDFLRAEHFYVQLHSKLYDAIIKFMERGFVATPITLKNYFNNEASLSAEGVEGIDYMLRLVMGAPMVINIESLAKEVHANAIRRRLIEIGQDTVNKAYDVDIKLDPMDQIGQTEEKLFQLACEGDVRDKLYSLGESVKDVLRKIEKAKKNKTGITGVDTGYYKLNDILGGGMQESDLIIIAARPSMGKTALAINIAVNAAKAFAKEAGEAVNSKSVCVFSLEMSAEQIASRIISMQTGIDGNKVRTGKVNAEEFIKISNSISEVNNLPLYIDDRAMLSISELRTKARRMKRNNNLGAVVVDYLQLMRGSSSYDSSSGRVLEIGEITNGLKAVAKELEVPVIALSQLSRAVESREKKRPLLSDLRESGNIEQDADVVMFIYRPEYYLDRNRPTDADEFTKWQEELETARNKAEIIIAKHRNGPVGSVELHYNSNTTMFMNMDTGH